MVEPLAELTPVGEEADMNSDTYAKGMKVRRKMLGVTHLGFGQIACLAQDQVAHLVQQEAAPPCVGPHQIPERKLRC